MPVDRQVRGAGLVEQHLERAAGHQQVVAVVVGIAGELVDLIEQVVVLRDQSRRAGLAAVTAALPVLVPLVMPVVFVAPVAVTVLTVTDELVPAAPPVKVNAPLTTEATLEFVW